MIQSFGGGATAELFLKRRSRRWAAIARVALLKLDMLEAAITLNDLRVSPANRLERLAHDRAGQHSIRINDQYRICFIWNDDGAHEVEIVDYHQAMEQASMTIKRPTGGWHRQGVATHPGEVLEEEFLKPLKISRHRLALDTHMPATRVGEIVRGRRSVSPDTALRLARYFGTSAEFWLNLQQQFDLTAALIERRAQIEREVQVLARA